MRLSYLTKIGLNPSRASMGKRRCESTVFARMTEVKGVWLP